MRVCEIVSRPLTYADDSARGCVYGYRVRGGGTSCTSDAAVALRLMAFADSDMRVDDGGRKLGRGVGAVGRSFSFVRRSCSRSRSRCGSLAKTEEDRAPWLVVTRVCIELAMRGVAARCFYGGVWSTGFRRPDCCAGGGGGGGVYGGGIGGGVGIWGCKGGGGDEGKWRWRERLVRREVKGGRWVRWEAGHGGLRWFGL